MKQISIPGLWGLLHWGAIVCLESGAGGCFREGWAVKELDAEGRSNRTGWGAGKRCGDLGVI